MRANCLGFAVHFHDPWSSLGVEKVLNLTRHDQLDDMLRVCDCVVLMTPMSQQNYHMIDARRLALMPPSSCIVNVSRGGLIDEQALADALHSGHIRAAALDVHEHEPDNVFASGALMAAPNLIATPHIAWYSFESERELRQRAAEQVRQALLNVANDRPLTAKLRHCINKQHMTAGK